MPNLVQELGTDYFHEFFSGSLFNKDDVVYKLMSVTRNSVEALDLAAGSSVAIPSDYFTGYKVFQWPVLGYRRMSEHAVAFLSKRPSTRRGLRADHVNVNASPMTLALQNLATIRIDAGTNSVERALSIMKPTFDNFQSGLPELLAGRKASLVLSENILIEPAVGGSSHQWYGIYYKETLVGTMNAAGRIRWRHQEHINLLDKFQKAA